MSLALGDIDKAALNALMDKLTAAGSADEAALIKGILDAENNAEVIAGRVLDRVSVLLDQQRAGIVTDLNAAISRLHGARLEMDPIAPAVSLKLPRFPVPLPDPRDPH